MKMVYLAHPYQLDAGNLARARRWLLWALRDNRGHAAFVAPWLIECELIPETPVEREDGLRRAAEVIWRCDEIWLCGGDITAGMRREVEAARQVGVAVVDLTALGDEPPEVLP